MKIKQIKIFLLVFSVFISPAAIASVVNSTDVLFGGKTYGTYQDTTTSLTWLDLNNFWGEGLSYNSLVSSLDGSGYHLATLPELSLLQSSMPADPANFVSDATIVGGNLSSRNLLWGIYEDNNALDGISWSWRFDYDTNWNLGTNVLSAATLLDNANYFHSDLGAWVVSDFASVSDNEDVNISTVPVPAAAWLFGSALLGFAGVSLRKKS